MFDLPEDVREDILNLCYYVQANEEDDYRDCLQEQEGAEPDDLINSPDRHIYLSAVHVENALLDLLPQPATTLVLDEYGIVIQLSEPDAQGVRCGRLMVSELHAGLVLDDESDMLYDEAMDVVETLLLAHACAGVNITGPAYLEGLATTLETLANKL